MGKGGERIREGRARLGISQQALAERLGTTQPQVSLWESGKAEPRPEQLSLLQGILGDEPIPHELPGASSPPSSDLGQSSPIRDRRKRLGISQAKLAAMVGVTQTTISIRRFNELANETAGDYFTPREVIRLMVGILFLNDDELLATPGTVRKLLDPACGTGGMLAEAQRYLREHHAEAKLYVYGQDYNPRAFATAASDMLMKEVSHNGGGNNVRFGDCFTEDQFGGETFDYFLTNPPFGVDWKKQQKEIEAEHDKRGFAGRFGAGLPRVNELGRAEGRVGRVRGALQFTGLQVIPVDRRGRRGRSPYRIGSGPPGWGWDPGARSSAGG